MKKGFTIIELIVVIAIIGVLAAIIIPTVTNAINKGYKAADEQLVSSINRVIALLNITDEFSECTPELIDSLKKEGITKIKAQSSGCCIAYDRIDNAAKLVAIDEFGFSKEEASGLFITEPEQIGRNLYCIETEGFIAQRAAMFRQAEFSFESEFGSDIFGRFYERALIVSDSVSFMAKSQRDSSIDEAILVCHRSLSNVSAFFAVNLQDITTVYLPILNASLESQIDNLSRGSGIDGEGKTFIIPDENYINLLRELTDTQIEVQNQAVGYKLTAVGDNVQVGKSGKNEGIFLPDSKVTLSAELSNGYSFEGWFDSENNKLSEALEFVFTMPQKDVILYAKSKQITHVLKINAINGTVTVNGHGYASPMNIAQGETVTISAQPNSSFLFKHWQLPNGNDTANPLTLTLTDDTEITAVFEQETIVYKLTYFDIDNSEKQLELSETNGVYTASLSAGSYMMNSGIYVAKYNNAGKILLCYGDGNVSSSASKNDISFAFVLNNNKNQTLYFNPEGNSDYMFYYINIETKGCLKCFYKDNEDAYKSHPDYDNLCHCVELHNDYIYAYIGEAFDSDDKVALCDEEKTQTVTMTRISNTAMYYINTRETGHDESLYNYMEIGDKTLSLTIDSYFSSNSVYFRCRNKNDDFNDSFDRGRQYFGYIKSIERAFGSSAQNSADNSGAHSPQLMTMAYIGVLSNSCIVNKNKADIGFFL